MYAPFLCFVRNRAPLWRTPESRPNALHISVEPVHIQLFGGLVQLACTLYIESNSLAKGEDWKKKLKERVTDNYALFESVVLRDIHCLSRGSASWDIRQTHMFNQEVTHDIYNYIYIYVRVQASTLTQNNTGPVGPVTPSICWSCKMFTGPTFFL